MSAIATTLTIDQEGRTMMFRVSGKAIPKERVRHRIVQPKGGRAFVQAYTPKETRDYEDRVREIARAEWGDAEPSMRPIELQITIHVEIPESWPVWKRAAATRGEIVPTGGPDTDNVVKTISDAMNGVVYRDDAQVVTNDAVKLYAPDGRQAWVDVVVRENYRSGSWITKKSELTLLR